MGTEIFMPTKRHLWTSLLLAGLIQACSSSEDSAQEAACEGVTSETSLADANNYLFEGSLDIQGYPLAAPGDPLIDWSGLRTDLLGHPIDPATEIRMVAAIVFERMSEDEVEEALSTDSLEESDLSLFVSAYPSGETSLHLSDLTLLGNDIDVEQYFLEGSGTWLFILTDSTVPGVGARMAAFLEPIKGASSTEADITGESALLSLDVDLQSLEALRVPEATPDLELDWSGLTTNGRGADWVEDIVDQVMIAHFPDLGVEDVQDDFADVELIADPLWRLDIVGGTSADLTALAEQDATFTGIDDDGTWAMALVCSTCSNPAPPFFTILESCPNE
jgi:hypothetical protein